MPARHGPNACEEQVGELFIYIQAVKLYAVSTTDGAVSSAGRFAFSQTFALQRPINGAATTDANAIAIAILNGSSPFPRSPLTSAPGTLIEEHLSGVFNFNVPNIGLNRY
jgi:hypothetical protein